VAQELFKSKSEFEPYESFSEYIETVHGIPYSEAMRAVETYSKLVLLESRGRR